MRLPAHISQLDVKTGLEWTRAEIDGLVAWWNEIEQERLVWYTVAKYLGAGATAEDVEEVWLDFYSTLLNRARISFRPIGPSFCTYLLDVCLKNYCVQRGNRIRRRISRETSLFGHSQEPIVTELEPITGNVKSDPLKCAEQKAFLEALNGALNEQEIKPQQRQAFLLRYIEDLSYPEVARELDAPEGTVKVWVHRVTRRIAARLKEQGWSE